jgi:hypothetical protein
MKLPIRFPDDADVIAAEAAQFRALSPREQTRVVYGLLGRWGVDDRKLAKSGSPTRLHDEQEGAGPPGDPRLRHAPRLSNHCRAARRRDDGQPARGHPAPRRQPRGLILMKVVAFRQQDQADIEAVLPADRNEVDLAVIRREWPNTAEGEDARTGWLEREIARLIPGR